MEESFRGRECVFAIWLSCVCHAMIDRFSNWADLGWWDLYTFVWLWYVVIVSSILQCLVYVETAQFCSAWFMLKRPCGGCRSFITSLLQIWLIPSLLISTDTLDLRQKKVVRVAGSFLLSFFYSVSFEGLFCVVSSLVPFRDSRIQTYIILVLAYAIASISCGAYLSTSFGLSPRTCLMIMSFSVLYTTVYLTSVVNAYECYQLTRRLVYLHLRLHAVSLST